MWKWSAKQGVIADDGATYGSKDRFHDSYIEEGVEVVVGVERYLDNENNYCCEVYESDLDNISEPYRSKVKDRIASALDFMRVKWRFIR